MLKRSLALRIFLLAFLFFVLPLVIYSVVNTVTQYKKELALGIEALEDLSKNQAESLSKIHEELLQTLQTVTNLADIAKTVVIDSADAIDPELHPKVNSLLTQIAKTKSIDAIFILAKSANDRQICVASSDPALIGKDLTADPVVINTLENGATSYILIDRKSEIARAYVARTVETIDPVTQKKEGSGIVIITESIQNEINNLLKIADVGYPVNFSLITSDNVILSSSDPALVLQFIGDISPEAFTALRNSPQYSGLPLKHGTVFLNPIPDYNAYSMVADSPISFAVIAPIEPLGLRLMADADKDAIFDPFLKALWKAMSVIALIFAIGGWLTYWLTIRLAKPFRSLCKVMEAVGGGDLAARFMPERLGFEINTVGGIFNQMISSLLSQMHVAEVERVQKETLSKELMIGHEIQMSLIPKEMPRIEGIELAGKCLPAKEVGGDFYDVFVKEGSKPEEGKPGSSIIVLTMADASDKGISACLYSISLRSMLRSYVNKSNDLGAVIVNANNLMCKDTSDLGVFVTNFMALYDTESHMLTYASCGHPPAFLCRKDGRVEHLTTPGIAMGVVELTHVDPKSVHLGPGECVLFYTDGVTEAHSKEGQLFKSNRLEMLLQAESARTAEEISQSILEAVLTFATGAPQHDDISILVLKRRA